MRRNSRETADLFTFTKEIPNGKPRFCAVVRTSIRKKRSFHESLL